MIKRGSIELVFVEKAGRREQPVSEMPVRITDEKGRVMFDGVSKGPLFSVRLPRGRYIVSTRWDAWSWSRQVTIGNEAQRVVFAWSRPSELTSLANG